MSAVIADATAPGGAVSWKRGKKKLIVIVAAALAIVLAAGGGTVVYLKKKAADAAAAAESGEEDGAMAETQAGSESKGPPTYLPLDPFVVNLADRDNDRYAQIGITLELESGVFADRMKAYMPAIRNAILMVIAHKSARDLLGRTGKEELAAEIMREAIRPMGIELATPEPITAAPPAATAASAALAAASDASSAPVLVAGASAPTDEVVAPKPRKPRRGLLKNPIQHVHFSSFIIQ